MQDNETVKLVISKTDPNQQTVTSKTTVNVLAYVREGIANGLKPHALQRDLTAQGFDTSHVFGTEPAEDSETEPQPVHGLYLDAQANPAAITSCGTPGKVTRYGAKVTCEACKTSHRARREAAEAQAELDAAAEAAQLDADAAQFTAIS